MMKIDLREEIKDQFGDPIETDRGNLTLGYALSGALFAPEQMSKEEKAKRYTWGMKLMNSDYDDFAGAVLKDSDDS